ncbi:GDSL esterase/lipase 1-like [Coffea arabica]|uniref:GDSL esterase/lipase 1-like n=1 Tax=Coffea arabica TaxID=13443 RepID=A0ABM4WN80_COFAR
MENSDGKCEDMPIDDKLEDSDYEMATDEADIIDECINVGQQFSLLVVLASLTIPSDYFHHDDHHPETTAALFVFGDSLVDPGNNNYINTTTGSLCDGPVIPDFIPDFIAEYAKLPFLPPCLRIGYQYQLAYGTNFASGGAGALVETFPGLVIDLQKQLWYFKEVKKQLRLNLGKRGAKQIVSNSVYLFHIGVNDYVNYFTNSRTFKSSKPEDYVKIKVMSSVLS